MYRKIVKGVLISVSTIFFALIMGYLAYYGTMSIISRTLSGGSDSNTLAESVLSDTIPENFESPEPTDSGLYFIAKLNGDKVEIYSRDKDAAEQFLYAFSVYVPDMPSDDVDALRRGIRFNTKEELLHFEEDFTD